MNMDLLTKDNTLANYNTCNFEWIIQFAIVFILIIFIDVSEVRNNHDLTSLAAN